MVEEIVTKVEEMAMAGNEIAIAGEEIAATDDRTAFADINWCGIKAILQNLVSTLRTRAFR